MSCGSIGKLAPHSVIRLTSKVRSHEHLFFLIQHNHLCQVIPSPQVSYLIYHLVPWLQAAAAEAPLMVGVDLAA